MAKLSARQIARNRRAQERAAELGLFVRNDYEYRKLVNAGQLPILRPERVKRKRTAVAQSKFYPRFRATVTPGDYRGKSAEDLFNGYLRNTSKEQLCQDWSDRNAVTNVMVFETKTRNRKQRGNAGPLDKRVRRAVNATTKRKLEWIDKHGKDAYIEIYYEAFVEGGPNSYGRVKDDGGSEALHTWLVDICGYVDQEEYDERYS